jgi:hypothetical protein
MKIRCIFIVSLYLTAAGLSRAASEETEYFAVFMAGKKIGYAIHSRAVAEGKVSTSEKVSMQVSRADVPVSMNMTETSIETTDGKPIGFEVVQDFGIMRINTRGEVDAKGVVNVTANTGGEEQKSTLEWPSGAVMAEGLRLLQQKQGLKEGLEYSANVFSPASMQALETRIQIGPKQNVDLLGRTTALTEVKTTIRAPGTGEIVSISYVDDDLRVKKSVTPMMGTQVEMIACSEEFAMGENEELDLADKMFLTSPRPLDNIESAKSVIYHLKPSSQATTLTIPSTDNQKVRRLRDGRVIVAVRPAAAPPRAKFPYRGRDSEVLKALQPTRYLQSDQKEIIELAKRAVGDTKDAAKAAKKIESFVSTYIENRELSVGYASAAEVAASRVGDCTEFAVLTATMCRAVGIPARVVCGLVYAEDFAGRENVFGGHAWVEAYIGNKWIGLDATRAPNGFDAGHIALAVGDGEPADFLGIVSTLGYFKIDKVVIGAGSR